MYIFYNISKKNKQNELTSFYMYMMYIYRVLRHAKESQPSLITKTSVMLGLNETEDEVVS